MERYETYLETQTGEEEYQCEYLQRSSGYGRCDVIEIQCTRGSVNEGDTVKHQS